MFWVGYGCVKSLRGNVRHFWETSTIFESAVNMSTGKQRDIDWPGRVGHRSIDTHVTVYVPSAHVGCPDGLLVVKLRE
jgi:hypothetical protein